MRTLLALSLVLTIVAPAAVQADVIPPSGPAAGLRTPLLDMGQAQVIYGMNKKGNYGGGT